jgi:hypothetical protein
MRETKKISTPSGAEVEIYSQPTVREMKAISEALFRSAHIDLKSREYESISGQAIFEAQDVALRLLIRAVNGENANAYERFLELPASDYSAVVNAVNEITAGKDFLGK